MKYGIQLYSIRDMAKTDFEMAVKTVADIGYGMIEFAGFYGRTSDEVCKLLADNKIEVWGTHTGIYELVNDFEGTVAYHKAIGNKNYIIPMHDLSTIEKIDDFVRLVNEYQPRLEKEGIKLGYHNHSFEFIPNADGSEIYKNIVERTNIYLEIDTYWVFNAGLDPVETLEKYKDRLLCIHIKDGIENSKGTPLGKGIAPVEKVYDKALQLGIPMIVESETLTPSGEDECRVCFEYLKQLEQR